MSTAISMQERKALLARQVAMSVGSGARVESQSDTMAVLIRGRPVNHLLHFFIGVFTLGLWWIVWLLLGITGGERREVVTVDEFGNVLVQKSSSQNVLPIILLVIVAIVIIAVVL